MANSSLAKLIISMGLLALLYGLGIGAFILREPDTCFLLSMGRWICEHQTLPTTDPFSYTFAMYPQPLGLVVYQWLTEVIFFSIYKLTGIVGLEFFGCTILGLSFLVLPWHILNSFSLGPSRAGIIVIWLALGTIDRMLLKPEIFSYLFLSLFILLTVKNEARTRTTLINWSQVLTLGSMMVLWANLHTGFVIGIIFTLLFALRDLFIHFYNKFSRQNLYAPYDPSWLFSFFACLIASFITPYGITLWKYIPHLYFHPVNHNIVELQPLSFTMVIHNFPLLISFFGLSGLAILQTIRKLRTQLSKSDILYILIAFIGIGLSIACMRMVTFALLLMLPLIASGFSIKNNTNSSSKLISMIPTIVLFFSLAGSLIICLLNNPTIPTTTKAFTPPFSALKYISEHKFNGNLLNDPTFGDVLIWNLDKSPLLFIDTRFDAYPWEVTKDYLVLRDCKPGWQKLIEQYHINWIFIPPSSNLCTQLSKNTEWQTAYKDQVAQILIHQ